MNSVMTHLCYCLVIAIVFCGVQVYYITKYEDNFNKFAAQRVVNGELNKTTLGWYIGVFGRSSLKGKSIQEVKTTLDGIFDYQNFNSITNKCKILISNTKISSEDYYDEKNKNRYFWYSDKDISCDVLLEFNNDKLVDLKYITP